MLKRFLILVLLLALPIVAVHAQGAPEQIQAALNALGTLIGRTVTLNDVYWSWAQETYNDGSLGCPKEGEMYAQVITVGYKFEFRVDGKIYDIRVSADQTNVRVCSVTDEAAQPTATPDIERARAISNALCPTPPEGITYMKTRLAPGVDAVVLPGLPNNLRDNPSVSANLLTQIPGDEAFQVVAGPTCDELGNLWWQVSYAGTSGYTVEGANGNYFVAPQTRGTIPAQRTPIAPTNITGLVEVARTYGAFNGGLAVSDADRVVLTGKLGSEGVWIYELGQFAQEARVLPADVLLTHAAFSESEELAGIVMVGAEDGTIRLWNTAPTASLIERVQLQSQREAVRAIAIHPDGSTMAAAGGLAITSENSLERDSFAIVIWNINTVSQSVVLRGHTDEVNALAWSADGAQIASASEDGTVRVWDTVTGAELDQFTYHTEPLQPVTALAWSPDGAWLAVGFADGSIQLNDRTGSVTDVVARASGSAVRGLAFNPDGTVLAQVGDDGITVLWDITNALGDAARHETLTDTIPTGALSVAFNADGTLLLVVGADNTLRVYGMSQG